MTQRTTALAAAVLMLGPLAACSGDESDSSGEAASSETPSASAGTPAPGDTESAEETRTDSGADPDAELTAADKAYCDEVATARIRVQLVGREHDEDVATMRQPRCLENRSPGGLEVCPLVTCRPPRTEQRREDE